MAGDLQGRMGLSVMAMSALDVALWDALGRSRDTPLWKLWDGSDEPLPVYGSGCYRGLGHDGMIEKAERFVADGFNAIKMQVAHMFTHDEDIANVRDMRAALGDSIQIMVDVNQGWNADEAIKVGRALDDFGLSWLEEPVIADDFDGYHQIADAINTPLAGGENQFTHHDFKPWLASAKVPIFQPDIMRGGYTELRRIAKLAEKGGQTIAPHLFPELMSHLNASIPNAIWLEYMGWFDHLWTQPVLPKNGFITPPDRPGHGMDFRPELFKDHPYRG
ncbi:MAG: mandelate racemase/muconate lactonizing enzyme family protein [Pseudomonadota bacterium]